MTGILHMETERVLQTAAQLNQTAEGIRQHSAVLLMRVQGLDWTGYDRDEFVARFEQLARGLQTAADDGLQLSQRVNREVEQWLLADSRFGEGGLAGGAASGGVTGLTQVYPENGLTSGSPGAAQGEIADAFDGHSEYVLLDGIEARAYAAYHSGKISWEEAQRIINEDPFKRQWVEVEGSIYKEEQKADWAAWEGKYLGDVVELNALDFEAKSSQKLGLTKDGLEAKLEGELGGYLGRAQAGGELAGIQMAGAAYVGGAVASGFKGSTNLFKGDLGVGANLEAFAGAKAGGSVSKDFEDIGIPVEVGARGAISYGIGGRFDADIGMENWHFKTEVDIGASIGLGAEGGFTVEVDVLSAAQKTIDIGSSAADWLGDRIEDIF